MASVVFIIRVPYQENSKSSKSEQESESSEGNKEENIKQQTDDIKGVKFENGENNTDKALDQNATEIKGDPIEDNLENLGYLDLAEVLQNELRSLKVQGDSWTVTNDKQYHQVVFLENAKRIENILERLTQHVGIGKRPKSSISIIPTSVHIQPQMKEMKRSSKCESINPTTTLTECETEPLLEKESLKDQFKKSIKSRLTVEQVVESVRMQAHLTFDFVMFTVLASLIAAVGLVEDNAVVLVASMLVSPLMGPILAGTFGTVIKNKSLRNLGLKTELCGLLLSVVVGFLFGCICGPFGVNGASWDSAKGIWPTQEMTSRGMARGLWVGVCIALPSGAGVALSVLGGNTGSLVGVAISASLLPPAVNSGMLLAYSIISAIKPPEFMDTAEFNTSTSKCPPFKNNIYMPTYSCDMEKEAVIMAFISLVLTVVNIICILITATIVLKIKEVTPLASSSNATQTFWTKDIKVAREAYETVKPGDQALNFLKEWRKIRDSSKEDEPHEEKVRDSSKEDLQFVQESEELLTIVEEVEGTEEYESVVRRAPRGAQNLHKVSRELKRLTSKDEVIEDNTADEEAMILQNTLRNLQTHYSVHPRDRNEQPAHVSTIFNEPNKKVREFHVVETEKPHNTSVVRVHPPTDESNTYSIKTESGV